MSLQERMSLLQTTPRADLERTVGCPSYFLIVTSPVLHSHRILSAIIFRKCLDCNCVEENYLSSTSSYNFMLNVAYLRQIRSNIANTYNRDKRPKTRDHYFISTVNIPLIRIKRKTSKLPAAKAMQPPHQLQSQISNISMQSL